MTLSLLAHDVLSGQMGVAIASLRFNVFQSVVTTLAGVGITCSQHLSVASFGEVALRRLVAGASPSDIIDETICDEPTISVRQFALLDARGEIAVHTGSSCVAAAGHIVRPGRSAQGAILLDNRALEDALNAFDSAEGALEARLLAGLAAGVEAGGDQRGHRAAAVVVVSGDRFARPEARLVDIQVHDHEDPIGELRRLLALRAFDAEVMKGLDIALSGDLSSAIQHFDILETRAPRMVDAAALHAMLLASTGEFQRARERFRVAFDDELAWVRYARRLSAAGFLPLSEGEMLRLTLETQPPQAKSDSADGLNV